MEKRNIPEVRFKGFGGEWKKEKLGDVSLSLKYGLNAAAKVYDGINKYLRITDIDDESRKFNYASLSSPDISLEDKEDYLLNEKDIVFARTGASVGKSYKYNIIDNKVYFAGFLIRARLLDNINQNFIYNQTLTENYKKFVKITSMRSGQPGINAEEYSKYKLYITEIKEQEKIGQLFESIDKMIEAQRKLIEENKKLKKSLLQKMFPKKGEKLPELRLKGFSGDWEEKRLREIGEIKTGKTPPTSNLAYYNKKGVMFITPTDINSRITTDTKRRLSLEGIKKSTIAKSGSILITCIASIGKNTLILEDSTFNQQINSITPYHEESSYFILVQSIVMSNYMKNIASSGIMQIINKTEFSNIKILVPSLKEQEAIGKLFKSLDEKIENEEKKLENYKNLKKSLLQKMFI